MPAPTKSTGRRSSCRRQPTARSRTSMGCCGARKRRSSRCDRGALRRDHHGWKRAMGRATRPPPDRGASRRRRRRQGPPARCRALRGRGADGVLVLDRETPELHAEGVRMRFIGRRAGIDRALVQRIEHAETLTKGNRRITLFVAFNYGGRAEIIDAAREFRGETEQEFRQRLYAPDMHDPDLLIRTSGERRISNYLLWQCAYSEFVFRDELWPDFDREAFRAALDEFEARQRRFGAR